MQHLNKLTQNCQRRKWAFDQNWNNVQNALFQQNQQRNDDVKNTKQNIQKKLNFFKELQTSKISIMNENIKHLKSQSDSQNRKTQQTLNMSINYQTQYQDRCVDFSTQYLNKTNLFGQKIIQYAKSKCNQVERKLSVIDQNIKRKTQEQMKELRQTSINHIKSMLDNQSANQKTCIQNLTSLVCNSLKNMRQTLKQFQKQNVKSQSVLQDKIQKLDNQMSSIINKQNVQGDMTYDCLLKLVQDSYGKIEQIRMR